jgi:hypothetical protein
MRRIVRAPEAVSRGIIIDVTSGEGFCDQLTFYLEAHSVQTGGAALVSA